MQQRRKSFKKENKLQDEKDKERKIYKNALQFIARIACKSVYLRDLNLLPWKEEIARRRVAIKMWRRNDWDVQAFKKLATKGFLFFITAVIAQQCSLDTRTYVSETLLCVHYVRNSFESRINFSVVEGNKIFKFSSFFTQVRRAKFSLWLNWIFSLYFFVMHSTFFSSQSEFRLVSIKPIEWDFKKEKRNFWWFWGWKIYYFIVIKIDMKKIKLEKFSNFLILKKIKKKSCQ